MTVDDSATHLREGELFWKGSFAYDPLSNVVVYDAG